MIYEGDDEERVGLGDTGAARTLSGMGLAFWPSSRT